MVRQCPPISAQRARPSSLYVADDGARDITEQLITAAGYDPVLLGGRSRARTTAINGSSGQRQGHRPAKFDHNVELCSGVQNNAQVMGPRAVTALRWIGGNDMTGGEWSSTPLM